MTTIDIPFTPIAEQLCTPRYDKPQRRYQRTANRIASGGNR